MPMTKKNGKPKKSELPSTLQKSGKKAQRTFAKAHDAAEKEYSDAERAHRVAYSALKNKFEKVGDHWEKKAKKANSKTAEGVDAHATKKHLTEIARKLDIPRRSTMNKSDLVAAINKTSRGAAAHSR
ncbi:ChaB family protein [Mycolicibacterium aichiense]|uniref:Rho termination factor-like N-terminal domain-containing protein n=1 Tax=Mycolicibacterium aichiense TaxID=1799 RepID=A0AAD1HS49_9MYCO|nr:ChaB family protein [Mycolicibacterium aichiense]MCV7016508.1 ChaB family protein [Mycolicibacterium aichiense]BBX09713.1 hypothetical protein MAIC_45160 [Mycolicibacterium aichiense]SUA14278.1 ChaB family protein [Mycolicibacterium aichiense]